MDDRYFTIEKPAVAETKVKGSRFIAVTHLVNTVDEALAELEKIRKREYAATHNCYAWRAGLAKEAQFKYSDDGEPSGTAGRPIYDVITGGGVDNILLVVTRYFGGTKLGTGGLVRAYSGAAKLALEQSSKKENFITDQMIVEIEFPLYDQIVRVIHRIGAIQNKADFSDHVRLNLEIRKSLYDRLETEIIELSQGRARIEKQ